MPKTDLYRLFNEDDALLYVGVSWSAIVRFAQGHRTTKSWADEVVRISIEKFDTRRAALDAERDAIKSEDPRHNGEGLPRRPYILSAPKEHHAEPEIRDWAVTRGAVPFSGADVWDTFGATICDMFRLCRAVREGDTVYHTVDLDPYYKEVLEGEGAKLVAA